MEDNKTEAPETVVMENGVPVSEYRPGGLYRGRNLCEWELVDTFTGDDAVLKAMAQAELNQDRDKETCIWGHGYWNNGRPTLSILSYTTICVMRYHGIPIGLPLEWEDRPKRHGFPPL